MSPRGGGGGGAGPRIGKIYEVRQDGEEPEQIGTQVYGSAKGGSMIWGANPNLSKKSKLIKGQKVIIPGKPPAVKLTGKNDDEMTFIIDNVEIKMTNARIIRTMDTASDGWTGKTPWTPGADPAFDVATRPFGYSRAAAYIGNDLLVGGRLYTVEPEMSSEGLVKGLHGYSFTADVIDSHMQPPYEFNGYNFKQLSEALLPQFGIKAVFETEVGAAFKRITAHEGDSVFGLFAKLAAARGMLISCTNEGDLLFLKAITEGTPVGTLIESEPMCESWKAVYDGRKRYHTYKCIVSGAKQGAVVPVWSQIKPGTSATPSKQGPSTIISTDSAVPLGRNMTFRADDTTPGSIQDAARWKRNRQFVESLTQPYPVIGWYAPDGSRWKPNTLITVVSATLGVPKGFTFCIRSVEFIMDHDKRSAVLHLVPPQAFTGKDLGEVWSL